MNHANNEEKYIAFCTAGKMPFLKFISFLITIVHLWNTNSFSALFFLSVKKLISLKAKFMTMAAAEQIVLEMN